MKQRWEVFYPLLFLFFVDKITYTGKWERLVFRKLPVFVESY